jgi:CRISPR/Cas system CSM-associated protein Csm2 small subunit
VLYCFGGDVMIICDQIEVDDVTMRQVYKYAELHKLPIAFNEWDSIQMAFNRVCRASICRTQKQIYGLMIEL